MGKRKQHNIVTGDPPGYHGEQPPAYSSATALRSDDNFLVSCIVVSPGLTWS